MDAGFVPAEPLPPDPEPALPLDPEGEAALVLGLLLDSLLGVFCAGRDEVEPPPASARESVR